MKHSFSPDVLALNPELETLLGNGKRTAKYRNVPTEVDGVRFDSIKEARDYQRLKLLEQAGQITNLRLQPEFVLQEAYTDCDGVHHRAIRYIADFAWDDLYTGKSHVLDSKGFQTKDFRLKAKMFRAKYPQYVFEVG